MSGFDQVVETDVAVVGTGVGGLTVALGCSPRSVALVSKGTLGCGGSSAMAQGGVAAAIGADDAPALHAADTLAAADGLADAAAVEVVTAEGPERIRRLLELGVRFDRSADGDLALGREAAHGRRRILHANGDATGAELVRGLGEAVRQAPEVELFEEVFAEDLRVEHGRVTGVYARGAAGRRILFSCRAAVLASGGFGCLYARTTNPAGNTGDGVAMAARAGARLADLELVQFHPTALDAAGADPMPLLTEALRGEGAILVDEAGERFMPRRHPAAELAPRDAVARAIWFLQREGRGVYLDAREAIGAAFPDRFPTVFALARRHGFDPRREPLPVSPAAHYTMGGIDVDLAGRTSLAGLWACGEVTSSGVHGANRLASNSLLEALVFGARVASDLRRNLPPASRASAASGAPSPEPDGADEIAEQTAALRRLAWSRLGLVRSAGGLAEALERLRVDGADSPLGTARSAGELRNLRTLAALVAATALARRESRGGHYRSDFPAPDPDLARRTFVVADAAGRLLEHRLAGEPSPRPAPAAAAAGGR